MFMMTQNWIKTYVIQILPALALIVYIIGFAYYMVYYYQFGINITSYITLTEVLISTLTPILIVIILSATFFAGHLLFRIPINLFCHDFAKLRSKSLIVNKLLSMVRHLKHEIRLNDKQFEQKNNKISFYGPLLILSLQFVVFSIVIPFNIYTGTIEVKYKYFWIVALLMFGFPCVGAYLRWYKKTRFQFVKFYCNVASAIILFISILICTTLLGIYNANLDKQNNEQRFNITMQNNVEYTDLIYNYIGECGSAIFLYNRQNESTVVINRANLVSLIYYNKKDNIYKRVIEDFMEMTKEKRRE